MQYDDEDELIAPKIRTTAGQLLREARLNHELTIEAVADELRLSVQLISDLENNTPDSRYKSTFIRGYLRAYARYVGISPALVVELYENEQNEAKPSDKVSRSLPQPSPNQMPTAVMNSWFKRFGGTVSENKRPIAAVLSIAMIGTALLSGPKETVIPDNMNSAQSKAVTNIAERLDEPKQPLSVKAEMMANKSPAEVSVKENVAVLKVEFVDTCWITVFDGNHKKLVTGMRDPKTPLVVEGKPPLRVMLGNPKVAQISYNGEPVDLDIPVKDEMVNLTLG